jgi:hypothetical protein
MNFKIKYFNILATRIKTEREFIEQFGNRWRSTVEGQFLPSMDKILGII